MLDKNKTSKTKKTTKLILSPQEVFDAARLLYMKDRTNQENRAALIIARDNLLNISK